eukprot:TRINITY_DN16532_c0_g1_i1.p1 TRINITY_DN16532_c0_g1~~TRINITY_DN16532_c0_g1_i1.p1  ORF type:complete len:393 (-),score=109.19 TRINITY_DN16532_c0_g1_i1:456-1634(-)
MEKYLKKHKFCCECANMVNRAFKLLMDEGREPAISAGEKCAADYEVDERGRTLNEDGSLNLFSGISACSKDGHVHLECDPSFISQLLVLAEPELSGLKQERHAKTVEIAQKEVLICIGITLYERFQAIHQRLREGEQICDLLCLAALKSLRKSLDLAAERKRGVSDLELLCQEIELADREKERKQAKKREKKSKQQQKKKDQKEKEQKPNCVVASDPCSIPSLEDGPTDQLIYSKAAADLIDYKRKARNGSGSASDTDSGLGTSGDTSPFLSREDERFGDRGIWMKGGSPELDHDFRSSSSSLSRGHSVEDKTGICQPRGHSDGLVHSLIDLLNNQDFQDEEEEEEGLSAEEIRMFYSKMPQLSLQRQQLREKLREDFAAICPKHGKCHSGC